MKDHVVYYKDEKGEWRWGVTAVENGERIGMSSEGYKNYADCVANLQRLGTMSTREFTAEVIET